MRVLSVVGAALLALPVAAGAQSILYNNGVPESGGDLINATRLLSDDFTLASSVSVSQIRFFTAGFTGTPTQYSGRFNWAILLDNAGTPGAVIASGAANPIASPAGELGAISFSQFDIEITALLLGPGTYRLQLQDPASEGSFYWASPSTVRGRAGWDALTGARRGADYSFQLLGTADVVPEPATVVLMATGLAGILVVRRRRKRADD
jgi:hypothetical protein